MDSDDDDHSSYIDKVNELFHTRRGLPQMSKKRPNSSMLENSHLQLSSSKPFIDQFQTTKGYESQKGLPSAQLHSYG
jgi:hypothetical protein